MYLKIIDQVNDTCSCLGSVEIVVSLDMDISQLGQLPSQQSHAKSHCIIICVSFVMVSFFVPFLSTASSSLFQVFAEAFMAHPHSEKVFDLISWYEKVR